jgi:hypothetical protein
MKRFRRWLIASFLPKYAHETLLEELHRTDSELTKAKAAIRELQRYTAGLEFALRHGN